MSKVDAQRAMREAKYARTNASGPTRREAAAAGGTPTTPAPPRSAAPPSTPKPDAAVKAAAPATGALCGHKSMNGRECTREAGHAEKSHRYG